ncbi:MAG: DUF1552 domain-containing protein, partial [Myxococcota bacterium]
YRNLQSKMSLFSVNVGQGSQGGAHCNTSAVIFVGERQRSVNVAGGGSIDQLVRQNLDPSGSTLATGLWWRRGACDAQALRVFAPDGSPRSPIKRPSEVFDRLFGSVGTTPPDPDDAEARLEARIRRSVLDAVIEDYRDLTGARSPLGSDSKLMINLHLDSIREVEQRLVPADLLMEPGGTEPPACTPPAAPMDPDIADYDRFTYGTGSGAPTIHWTDVEQVFRLHADLWVLALRCDRVRFGNIMFESAGGHTNLTGTYQALGESTDFPGSSQHDSYFHGNQRREARLYQHLAQRNIAYFLEQLNDGAHLEPNGQTVLDNSTVVIGTEYGWNHSKQDVFHAVVGGGGRFRSGIFTDRRMNAIDLYNAILQGFGIEANIGDRTNVDSEGDASVLLA